MVWTRTRQRRRPVPGGDTISPVVAFARHSSDPVRWLGDSTCQHGHDSILAWLRANYPLFLTDPNQFTTRIQGNLGECMAFCIGHFLEFTDERPFAMNALAPLDDISLA